MLPLLLAAYRQGHQRATLERAAAEKGQIGSRRRGSGDASGGERAGDAVTDTERLDWLEQNHDTVKIFPAWHFVVNPWQNGKCWRVDGERIHIGARTLREAIDRAAATHPAGQVTP